MLILTSVCYVNVCTLSLATSQEGGACTLHWKLPVQMCIGHSAGSWAQSTVAILLQLVIGLSLCSAHTPCNSLNFSQIPIKETLLSFCRKACRAVAWLSELSKASSVDGAVSVQHPTRVLISTYLSECTWPALLASSQSPESLLG